MERRLRRRNQQDERADPRHPNCGTSRRRRAPRFVRSVDLRPIVLERGVTYDTAFEQWANKVWDYSNASGATPNASLEDFRKDIIIELYNAAGQKMLAYAVHSCWVSQFQAMTDLDAGANAVAIQTLVLQNEGWDRD